MPLYDCLLLAKASVKKEDVMDLVGQRVYQRNGAITELKSFGTIQLGYGIRKLDGRHFQMTVMVPPTFNKELQYLNKEDRLLRWLVVKHRDTRYGLEFINEYDGMNELSMFRNGSLYTKDDDDDDDDDDNDDDDDDDEEDGEDFSNEEYPV